MNNTTKKVLFFCLTLFVLLGAGYLLLYFFHLKGLIGFIIVLFLGVMAFLIHDYIMFRKEKDIIGRYSSTLDFAKGQEELEDLLKHSLPRHLYQEGLINIYICLLYSGRVKEAADYRFEYLPEDKMFRSYKKSRLYYSFLKDEALISGNKTLFLDYDKEEREQWHLSEEDGLKEKQEALFCFSLNEGFIDKDLEEEVLSYLEEDAKTSKLDALYLRYIKLQIAFLRHQDTSDYPSLLQDSEGTFIHKKALSLKNKTD